MTTDYRHVAIVRHRLLGKDKEFASQKNAILASNLVFLFVQALFRMISQLLKTCYVTVKNTYVR